jgi:hypothetical protein
MHTKKAAQNITIRRTNTDTELSADGAASAGATAATLVAPGGLCCPGNPL